MKTNATNKSKSRHARILEIAIGQLMPATENDELYRPIHSDDQEIQSLAASIDKHGVQEPLVVTADYVIISGHRRYTAAKVAGLATVPCRVESISYAKDRARFLQLLRECNRQRIKTFDEKLREELVSTSPEQAYESLIAHRDSAAQVAMRPLKITGNLNRARISPAKQPLLDAVLRILTERRKFLPISDRQIHYALLNDPPLRHASKPESRYANDNRSYIDLTDLVTRARVEGIIPMAAIADETRPVTNWDVFGDPSQFMRRELDSFLSGYWRNLQQSQPNHIEVVVEKNSVAGICRPVFEKFCLPMTSGRGYCSLPPRHAMAERFKNSGKQKLVLLLISDFDADGEEIAHSFAKSMRDDFGITELHPIKVALTAAQAKGLALPRGLKAKEGSSNYRKFVAKYGHDVWELEALSPAQLQEIITEAIDSVLDRTAFNLELDAERCDATRIQAVRTTVLKDLQSLSLDEEPING